MRRLDAMDREMLSDQAIFLDAQPRLVSEFVSRNVGTHRMIPLTANGGNATSSLRHQADGGISFSLLRYGVEVEISGPPQISKYQIQLIRSGTCRLSHGKQDYELRTGEAVLINPYYSTRSIYQGGCEKLIVAIDKNLLEAKLNSRLGFMTTQRLEFSGLIDRSTCDGTFLLNLLNAYCETWDLQASQSGFAAVNQIMRDTVTDAIILCARNSHSELLAKEDGPDPAIRRIAEYVTANIQDDISVADLAAEVNIGERRLFKIFQLHLQTTPLLYIKSVKLQHVKKAIEQTACNGRTVTDIATDYGFGHLGRFSMEYRRIHGELPSETLMRVRRSRNDSAATPSSVSRA